MTTANDTYDFIVTGAGSAGCAVAGRLSESGRWRVLLLEAGGRDSNPWIHIPLGYTKTFTNPRVNWMFESEPEKELNDRTLYQPRGKVLGGTSSINGMVYMRGTPTDYDGWRQRGCEGWDWDSVLPFFKKAEDQERGADDFHGVGGPLHVSNPVRSPLGDAMVAGLDRGRHPGQPRFQRRPPGGRRLLPDDDHQPPALEFGAGLSGPGARPPEPDRRDQRARHPHPVRGRPRGRRRIPHAERAARPRGRAARSSFPAASTARRSCCSFPGSARPICLSEFGIPVVRDMPGVGKNLHDHFNTYLVLRCPQKVTVNDMAMSPALKLKAARAIRGQPLRPSVECRDLCRRPRPHRPAARTARSADQHVRLERDRAAAHRHQAAPVFGLHVQPGASAPRRPRHGADQEPRPAGAAGDPVQFPGQRLRFPGADLRHAAQPQDRGAAGVEAVRRRGGIARPAGARAKPR